jgi:large repetitive protein
MKRLYPPLVIGLLLLLLLPVNTVKAQCGPGTPTITCDLTGAPDSVWISPSVVRNDNCCGTTAPDRCVKFIITLDAGAVGINFNIASGAVPPGALFYQINCGPPIAVGSPICLDGPGPHILTFCKPGNNQNTYSIESIPGVAVGTDIIVNDGCIGSLEVTGLTESTITWNSIFPGTSGQYNNYLSCASACSTTVVTAQVGYPPFVDYVVCGISPAACNTDQLCDTVRVTFNPTLYVNIVPVNPTVCFGAVGTSMTAVGTGGTPPYTYQWNTGATTATINSGVGTYTVILGDASGCPPVTTSVTVTAFANPITANAGVDQVECATSPTTTLAGVVTGTTTGIWSGGTGTFLPNNTTLNATYTPSAAELAAGSVTLTLTTTNNGSCPAMTDNVTITYPTFSSTITMGSTPVLCNGGSNGTATATVTGGFTPVTYSWNTTPVQTTATATGLIAGSYTVTVTDNIGCFNTATVTVTQPFPLSSNTQQDNVLCNGGSSGSAFVQVFGGTLPYSYLWSPSGSTAATASGLADGTHTVTITDGNGCTHQSSVVISQPPALALTVTNTPVSCFGGSNGTATATVTGGTTPYTYLWSNSSTGQIATGLIAGTYNLTVTDLNGCQITGSTTITEPTALIASVNTTNVTCFSFANGTASAVVSGGTPGYTYNWNPGTGSSVNSLAPGSYTVVISDLNSCQTFVPFTITQPTQLTLALATNTPVSCFGGSDGTASVAANGGTPGYTYSWSPNVGTTSAVTNLSAATYTATVTDSNNCTAQASAIILQPLAPLSASSAITNVTCFNGADGGVIVSPSGGTSGYTILWTHNGSTSFTESGFPAGTFNYIVTDANGCTFNGSATVTQPLPINLSTSSTNATCGLPNGSATVTATGGAGGYSYNWSPNVTTSNTVSGIAALHYDIIVTDAAGCTNSTYVDVNDLTSAVAIFTNPNDISCYGGSDGSVTVVVTSGNPTFTYLWSPSGSTSTTPTNLQAGIHTVQITDVNGCQSYFTVSLSQPDSLSVVLTSTPVSCFGGSDGTATAFATGGTPGYGYSWSPAAGAGSTGTGFPAGNATVTVTDTEGCTKSATIAITQPTASSVAITGSTPVSCFGGNNGTATALASGGTAGYTYSWSPGGMAGPNATGLSMGSYMVTSTDANGCTATNSVTITQPAFPLSVAMSSTPVSCFGGNNGTATATPSGGTSGYFYAWSSASQTSQTAINLVAGNHTVAVTDANGCMTNGIVTVTEPASLSATIQTNNSTCGNSNGSASVQVNGGNAPYTYTWSPGGFTTPAIMNVATNTYTVQVTDNTGCTTSASAVVNNTPGPTASISSSSNVTCNGGSNGSATVAIASGTAPFSVLWLPTGGTGLTASNLAAGGYSVTITDANGCQTFTNATITQPAVLNPTIASVNNVSCFGGSNGSISTNVTGGTGSYTYTWSPIGGSGSGASNLPIGNYTIVVTDQNGCTSNVSATVTQPTALTVSVTAQSNPLCFAGSNGTATVAAGGGTTPYSYIWNTIPAQISATASGLAAGTHSVTATDANGCSATTSATLSQPTPVVTTVSADDTICGGQSANIAAFSSGGTAPYFYTWSPNLGNGSSYTVSPAFSTTYTVTAYDNNGCAGNTEDINVEVYYLNLSNLLVEATTPICLGTTSTVYATVSGSNVGPLSYSWNQGLGTGPGSFAVTPTTPTWYTVTVTNSCGITISDSVQVVFNPNPTIVISSDVMSGCVPVLVNFADLTNTNTADSIYSWLWTFGDGTTSTLQNPSHTYPLVGAYNVSLSVTTYGGCSGSSTGTPYVINVYPVPTASFTVNSTTLNIPMEVLTATNTSSGGTSYQWSFGEGGTSTQTNPSYFYTTLGDYVVTLITTNQFGCSDTAMVDVTTTSDIVFPNAFTPNSSGPNGGGYNYGDLTNDVFFPYTAGVDNFHLMIFNRWGELIFETFDIRIGWDGYYRGLLCEQGVYVWKAEVSFEDGRTFNQVGDVTLLR